MAITDIAAYAHLSESDAAHPLWSTHRAEVDGFEVLQYLQTVWVHHLAGFVVFLPPQGNSSQENENRPAECSAK